MESEQRSRYGNPTYSMRIHTENSSFRAKHGRQIRNDNGSQKVIQFQSFEKKINIKSNYNERFWTH